MDEITEKRTVVHDLPVGGRPVIENQYGRVPVIENQYDHVSVERRGLSGPAIAAMVIGAVLVAMLITWLIVSNQQKDELALEREKALVAERNAAQVQAAQSQSQPQPQPQQSQQPIVVMPQSQPAAIPVPVPTPAEPTATAPSSMSIEVDVNRKLLDDRQLSPYPITVKIENGTATLEGTVPTEDLKTRAEKVTGSVKGIRGIINNITVRE
jgi:type II secretory pathway pseudopilin PulG